MLIRNVIVFFTRASLYRLKAYHSKLCDEIDAEKDVGREISHRLEEAEYVGRHFNNTPNNNNN